MEFVVIVSCDDQVFVKRSKLKLIFYTVILEEVAHLIPHSGIDFNDWDRLRSPAQIPYFDGEVIPRDNIFARCQKLYWVNFGGHFSEVIIGLFCLFLEIILSVFAVVQRCPQIVELYPSFCGTYSEDIVWIRMQFRTCYFLSFFPIFFGLYLFHDKRAAILLEVPHQCSVFVSRKQVFLVSGSLCVIYRAQVPHRK